MISGSMRFECEATKHWRYFPVGDKGLGVGDQVLRVRCLINSVPVDCFVTRDCLTDVLGAKAGDDLEAFSRDNASQIESAIKSKAQLRAFEPDGSILVTNLDRP